MHRIRKRRTIPRRGGEGILSIRERQEISLGIPRERMERRRSHDGFN